LAGSAGPHGSFTSPRRVSWERYSAIASSISSRATTRELVGNPDASIDDIAHAANVVRRTVYSHFPTREALIDAIADQAVAEITKAYENSIRWPAGTSLDVIAAALAPGSLGQRPALRPHPGGRRLAGPARRVVPRSSRNYMTCAVV
jgi:AcrR family transcriptional regulator